MLENLLNNFTKKGISESAMMNDLKIISDMTEIKVIQPYYLYIYTILHTTKEGLKIFEVIPDLVSIPEIFNKEYFEEHTSIITKQDFFKIGLNEQLVEEILDVGYFIKYCVPNEKPMLILPSENLLNALSSACGAGKLLKQIDPMNLLYLGYLLSETESFSILLRKEGKIAKAFTAFSEKHIIERQDERIDAALKKIREHEYYQINKYQIDHQFTTVEVIMPNMKMLKRGIDKNYLVTPSFNIILNDAGDSASVLKASLTINGHQSIIGEPIPLCDDEFPEMLSEEFKLFDKILEKLSNVSEDTADKKESVRRIMKKLGFSHISKKYLKLYENYMNTFSDTAPKIEILFEILCIPAQISFMHMQEYKKLPPDYVMKKIAKLSGRVFTLDIDRECF